jgi:glycosyltransferase involved in cell wall biosynthesis
MNGIFIQELAKACSIFNEVVVLCAYSDPSPEIRKLYRISESTEDGIRTIRVRYGGVIFLVKRQISSMFNNLRGRTNIEVRNKESIGPSSRYKTIPRTFGLIIGDIFEFTSIFLAFHKLVRNGWRPDIINAHLFFAGVPAVILGKLYRIPVVLAEHYSGFLIGNLTLPQRMKARFAMRNVKAILPVSYSLEKAIRAHNIKNTFYVVPNTVSTDLFHVSDSKRCDNGNIKRILSVASLKDLKGINYLIEALARIKEMRQDFTLDIIGDGPKRIEYERIVEELNLKQIIRFHGIKSKEQVSSFMQNCDFFIHPSLWETFGVVCVEVMACGKPVIATNVGGLKELINSDVGLLVPPGDTDNLVQSILYMLDNYFTYNSENIAKYVMDRFSYEQVSKRLNMVYREVTQTEK